MASDACIPAHHAKAGRSFKFEVSSVPRRAHISGFTLPASNLPARRFGEKQSQFGPALGYGSPWVRQSQSGRAGRRLGLGLYKQSQWEHRAVGGPASVVQTKPMATEGHGRAKQTQLAGRGTWPVVQTKPIGPGSVVQTDPIRQRLVVETKPIRAGRDGVNLDEHESYVSRGDAGTQSAGGGSRSFSGLGVSMRVGLRGGRKPPPAVVETKPIRPGRLAIHGMGPDHCSHGRRPVV
jgi:hypothetical protein